jgi:hypothetical protein
MKQWQWVSLLAGGAVVVVGGVILLEKKSAASSTPTPSPSPTPAIPASTTPQVVVLTPGTVHIQSANVNGYYAQLPTGQKAAKWLTQNGFDIRSAVGGPVFVGPTGSAPIAPQTFTYVDPNDGSAQTVTVYVDS